MKKIFLIVSILGFYHIAKAQLVEPHTTGMPGQEMSETPPTHLDPNVFADLKVLT